MGKKAVAKKMVKKTAKFKNAMIKTAKVKQTMKKMAKKKQAKKSVHKKAKKAKKKVQKAKKKVKKAKKKVKAVKKTAKKAKHREEQQRLGAARFLSGLRDTEKYVNFDKHGKCNYNPPAGCGCNGQILPAQTQPREDMLGESQDPTSTGSCPNMPADCTCRASQADVTEVDLVEEGEGETSKFYASIVCRMRLAFKMAKANFPRDLATLKASKPIKEHAKVLRPLLSCVEDAHTSNSKCESLAANVASCWSCADALPVVKHLQHKLGAPFLKGAKKCG